MIVTKEGNAEERKKIKVTHNKGEHYATLKEKIKANINLLNLLIVCKSDNNNSICHIAVTNQNKSLILFILLVPLRPESIVV